MLGALPRSHHGSPTGTLPAWTCSLCCLSSILTVKTAEGLPYGLIPRSQSCLDRGVARRAAVRLCAEMSFGLRQCKQEPARRVLLSTGAWGAFAVGTRSK